MIYRVRIKEPNGNIKVLDMAESQISEYLPISREMYRKFIRGTEVTAPNGDAVYMINHLAR